MNRPPAAAHLLHTPCSARCGQVRGCWMRAVCGGLLGWLALPLSAANPGNGDAAAAGEAAAIEIVEFNEDLLRIPVDVRLFAEGNPVLPGSYRVDLRMNGQWKGRTEVRFALLNPGDRIALPCFDLPLLEQLGFDMKQVSAQAQAAMQDGTPLCRPLGEMVDGAKAQYDSTSFRLDVGAPQAVLAREARGYVNPALWDDGITAGMLNYDYNAYRSEFAGNGQPSQYLGLRAAGSILARGGCAIAARAAIPAAAGSSTTMMWCMWNVRCRDGAAS